jgi:hypothetical protein
MTTTVTCSLITVTSDILDDFDTLSENTLVLQVKQDCGVIIELDIILDDIDVDSFSFSPNDLGQVETFSDGVYSLTLISTEDDSITKEFACIFMDCVTKCKVVNATTELKTKYGISSFKDFNLLTDPLEKKATFDTMYMLQLYTALTFIGDCTDCTCDNGCIIWCELQKLLGEDGCYTC